MLTLSLLGQLLCLIGLFCAGAGAAVAIAAAMRKSLDGLRVARRLAYGFGVSMLAANVVMIWALHVRDFSVHYVAEVGGWSTPTMFNFAALWASLNGSILLWGGVLGLYVLGLTFTQRNSHREYMPWTLAVLLVICVFFSVLVCSIANPFEASSASELAGLCMGPSAQIDTATAANAAYICPDGMVPDGRGPNALLQNHWLMAFHPPTLYLGYVGMAVPFSMCCAALLAGRLEAGWMAPLRRWFLIPWAFLSVGIVMGGWWSYAVLGWGGYWAWDPVENASFMPWLLGTAFLHSAMMMQRRHSMKTWALVLGVLTFVSTLFGTFLTRSGVFNSVHAFAEGPVGPAFLGFIVVVLVGSVILIAVQEPAIRTFDGGLPPPRARSAAVDPGSPLLQWGLGALLVTPPILGAVVTLYFLGAKISEGAGELPIPWPTDPVVGGLGLGSAAAVVLGGAAAVLLAVPPVRRWLRARGASFLLQNLVFCLFTFIVFLGTTYPLAKEYFTDVQVTVGPPYFDFFALPLGVTLVWLMGVGPLLPWARTSVGRGYRLFLPPLGFALVVTAIFGIAFAQPWSAEFVLSDFLGHPYVLLAVFVCSFALWANATQFVEPVLQRVMRKSEMPWTAAAHVFTRGRRRFGGHIAHFGIILCVASLAGTMGFSSEEDVILDKGVPHEFAGYTVTYEGNRVEEQARRTSRIATIRVGSGGSELTVLEPSLNQYRSRNEPLPSPEVYTTLSEDLFVSLMRADTTHATVRLIHMPLMVWLWIGAPVVGFGALLAIVPPLRRRRRAASGADSAREAA